MDVPTIKSIYTPEQIHLSYTGKNIFISYYAYYSQNILFVVGDPHSMFITWATLWIPSNGSATFYPADDPGSQVTVEATMTPLVHKGIAKLSQRTTYIYRATMQPLQPNTTYQYFLRSGLRESVNFNFTTFPNDTDNFKPRFAIYGDMGVENHVALEKLVQEANHSNYDMLLHNGDFAYDMNEQMGLRGDIFMNLLMPITTKIPINVAVGNHEEFNNFTEYSGRFSSPGPSVFYNSFNLGPVHIIMFSSEFYFYDNYGIGQLQAQYNWLVKDLAAANEEEARSKTPWILAMAHRPMYCSSRDGDDCTKRDSIMRTGYKNKMYPLEKLFFENGVDLQFYAHEHDYERLYPIFNYTFEKVEDPTLYSDPKYPVHVISGSAGCREIHDPFSIPEPAWSYFRSNNYGYTLLTVEDKLRLKIQQYSIEQARYIDEFEIVKSTVYPNFDKTSHVKETNEM